jgi:hypothetical protein
MHDPARSGEEAVDLREVIYWLDLIEGRYRERGAEEALATLRELRANLGNERVRQPKGPSSVEAFRAAWLQRVERILTR